MPDSDFTTLKRNSYAAKRAASQGAGITLCNVSGAYCADFECAQKCKEILGPEIHGIPGYSEHGYPGYRIPIYEAYSTIQKLSHHCSVALIEHAPDKQEHGRFLLVFKVEKKGAAKPTVLVNLDDF